jgi:hypothetical protein
MILRSQVFVVFTIGLLKDVDEVSWPQTQAATNVTQQISASASSSHNQSLSSLVQASHSKVTLTRFLPIKQICGNLKKRVRVDYFFHHESTKINLNKLPLRHS